MTKKELKPGMLVKLRNGNIYVVQAKTKSVYLLERAHGRMHLISYEEDLTLKVENHSTPVKWDIIEVKVEPIEDIVTNNLKNRFKRAIPVWERDNPDYYVVDPIDQEMLDKKLIELFKEMEK